ncbi:MAG: protein D-63 [Nitrososphaeria archaeon]
MSENNKMTNTIKNKLLSMLNDDTKELITLLNEIMTGNLDRQKLGKMYLQTQKIQTELNELIKITDPSTVNKNE